MMGEADYEATLFDLTEAITGVMAELEIDTCLADRDDVIILVGGWWDEEENRPDTDTWIWPCRN